MTDITLQSLQSSLDEAEYFSYHVGRFGHPDVSYRSTRKDVNALKRKIRDYKRANGISFQMSKETASEIITDHNIVITEPQYCDHKYVLSWDYKDIHISEPVKDGRELVRIAKEIDSWKENIEWSYM